MKEKKNNLLKLEDKFDNMILSCSDKENDPFILLNSKFSIYRKIADELSKMFPESKIHSKLASGYNEIIHTIFYSYSKVIDGISENEAYAKSINI
jgi:hypothetical protein